MRDLIMADIRKAVLGGSEPAVPLLTEFDSWQATTIRELNNHLDDSEHFMFEARCRFLADNWPRIKGVYETLTDRQLLQVYESFMCDKYR